MTHGHLLWWLLVVCCVVWYSSVTLLVAVRGSRDVLRLFRDLEDKHRQEDMPGT